MGLDLNSFITETFIPLIPFLYILGYAIKKTEFIQDKHIPIILIAIGGLSGLGIGGISFISFIQGCIVGGATVGVNEVKKQTIKEI